LSVATDTIINNGVINGIVDLFGASDFFYSKGGSSGDVFAGAGNDVIVVGKNNVSVHVGAGKSMITAGPGHDRFFFDHFAGGPADVIKHFNPLIDKVVLSEADFPGIGPHGKLHATHFGVSGNVHNPHPQIVYNQGDGFLFYDSNGDLPGGQTHFATLVGHPPLKLADFLVEA
jgi:Ca2+-binding RTX toxin-like protein